MVCPFPLKNMTQPASHLFVVLMLSVRARCNHDALEPQPMAATRILHLKQIATQELNRSLSKDLARASDENFYNIWSFATVEVSELLMR